MPIWYDIQHGDERVDNNNYIDAYGNLLFDDWIVASGEYTNIGVTSVKNGQVYVYHWYETIEWSGNIQIGVRHSKTEIYDETGLLVWSKLGDWRPFASNSDWMIYRGYPLLYDMRTDETQEYQNVEIVEGLPTTAIVSDGIFFGLWVDGVLYGKGVNYTTIKYNDVTHVFTLKVGASEKRIKVLQSGRIIELD